MLFLRICLIKQNVRLVIQPVNQFCYRRVTIKILSNFKIFFIISLQDSPKPEDQGRKFIISYRLSDDMIVINEPPVRNSGRISGKFLERTRVAKPNSQPDKPEFYGPQDFYIGAKLDIFRHKFVITNADHFVLKYMEMFPEHFPSMLTFNYYLIIFLEKCSTISNLVFKVWIKFRIFISMIMLIKILHECCLPCWAPFSRGDLERVLYKFDHAKLHVT